jgi:hypothetical protein
MWLPDEALPQGAKYLMCVYFTNRGSRHGRGRLRRRARQAVAHDLTRLYPLAKRAGNFAEFRGAPIGRWVERYRRGQRHSKPRVTGARCFFQSL